MENSIVSVRDLSHRYSVQWAVRNVNLEIPGNGVYGLLGSNGAGKSTIMNIMCGVLKQTQGQVIIKGVDMRKDPIAAKCHIGFLPQKPPLHMDLTVEEYLTHCAFLREIDKREVPAAVERVMERCEISHFRKRVLRNLSGGYQQRVGIAQAIIHNPDFVVLDEPTNGLDPNQILEIRHLIKEIAEHCTILLSTHILTEIQATCDYIYMVEQGEVVFSGTVDEFDNYIAPNTMYVTLMERPAADELLAIPGIVGVEPVNGNKYRINFNDSADLAERLIEESRVKGWRMTEIYLEKNSMDAVFAELSKKRK